MSYSHLLFDLDGTLTDPAEGIINSVIHALKKNDIEENDRKKLKNFIGPPLHVSFIEMYGFSEAKAFEAVDHYREYFSEKGLYENKLYPGIAKLLNELKQDNKIILLATSKPLYFAMKILRYFHLIDYFDDLFGANMDGSMTDKSDIIANILNTYSEIPKNNFLMIGDREHDIIGARNNGIHSVWVEYGFGESEVILDLEPEFCVDDVEGLKMLFSNPKGL